MKRMSKSQATKLIRAALGPLARFKYVDRNGMRTAQVIDAEGQVRGEWTRGGWIEPVEAQK